MKTAMQELIDWVKDQVRISNGYYPAGGKIEAKATELLAKEKEQIEKAYKNPYRLARVHPGNNMNKDFEEYYTQTYNS